MIDPTPEIVCPNCSAMMREGQGCPECNHTDKADAECGCAYCTFGPDDDSDVELDDASDADSELDFDDEEDGI